MKQFNFLLRFVSLGVVMSFGVQFTMHGDVNKLVENLKEAVGKAKKLTKTVEGGVGKGKKLIEKAQSLYKNVKNVKKVIEEKGKKLVEESKILQNVVDAFTGMTTKNEPMQNAYVRQGNDLSSGELEAIKKRAYKAKNTIYALTDNPLAQSYLPGIGVVASGGGFRAMIGTAAFLKGLRDIGMLDAVLYAASLSGSTWALNTWLAHGFSVDQLHEFLKKQTARGIDARLKNRDMDVGKVLGHFAKKALHKQKVTICDLYGALLASLLFEGLPGDGQKVYLEDQRKRVESGAYPFPLYTAVEGRTRPYEWLEFTPYDIGSAYFNAWIKPETFGRRYMNGKQVGKGPQQRLGYCMGIFGSAYSVGLGDVLTRMKKMIKDKIETVKIPGAPKLLKGIIDRLPFDELGEGHHKKRPISPEVRNFVRGMSDTPLADKKNLKPIDAGFDSGVPFPPMLRRGLNLLLICEMSDGVTQEKNILVAEEEYAHRKGYKFPSIDRSISNEGETVRVFYDKNDPEVPVVVYFPNQVSFSTFKFQYSNDEFDKLYDYMHNAVVTSRDVIIKALQIALENTKKIWDRQP